MARKLYSKMSRFHCLIALLFFSLALIYKFRTTSWKTIRHASDSIKTECLTKHASEVVEGRVAPKPHPKKINVFILSLPRSGSSFLGDVFNHHPQVLYLFEPLHSLQRSFSYNTLFHFDFSLASYQKSASKFLDDVMSCKFVSGEFTRNIFVKDRYRSFALTSSNVCFNNGTSSTCHAIDPLKLEALCKNNYSVVALKILTPRLPGSQWKKNLLPNCPSNLDGECRIIHLVRDPRAVTASLMSSVNFFKRKWEPKRELNWFVEKLCRQLESDVTVGMLTRSLLGERYKLIRFEDLASDSFSPVNDLFKFAGIDMLDEVSEWLYKATHAKDMDQRGIGKAFQTNRDSERTISKWRTSMKSATVQMVEKHCGRVMGQLGYKLIGISMEKQNNLNISLIDRIPSMIL